jgi:hypothetical protein
MLERERRDYVKAVLEWQRGYGCLRREAELRVSELLGIETPNISAEQWRADRGRRCGRPAAERLTRVQSVGILAAYYTRRGARPMSALALAKRALPRGVTVARSKAMAAVQWARLVIPDGQLAVSARAAWAALGAFGPSPEECRTDTGRGPGRPKNRRFKGTNYRGV